MKKKLLVLSTLFAGVVFGFVVAGTKPLAVKADDGIKTVEVNEEEQSSWEKFKDTFLVPILSGVSVTSIASMLISVVFAFLNRSTNKKIMGSNSETISIALKVIEQNAVLIEKMEESNKINQEAIDEFKKSTAQIIEKVSSLATTTENLLKIKDILIIYSEIETKLAMSNEIAVAKGISKDISDLNNKIKELE